jgi:hypothetical protein
MTRIVKAVDRAISGAETAFIIGPTRIRRPSARRATYWGEPAAPAFGFRHFCSGSLALASPNRACRNLVPAFPQRSTTVAFDDSSLRWLEINT